MTLADLIIESGPFVVDDIVPTRLVRPTAADFNELREELIAARRATTGKRFEVYGLGSEVYGAVALKCHRCPWQVETDTTSDQLTLAELVQRAEEHTEVCR